VLGLLAHHDLHLHLRRVRLAGGITFHGVFALANDRVLVDNKVGAVLKTGGSGVGGSHSTCLNVHGLVFRLGIDVATLDITFREDTVRSFFSGEFALSGVVRVRPHEELLFLVGGERHGPLACSCAVVVVFEIDVPSEELVDLNERLFKVHCSGA